MNRHPTPAPAPELAPTRARTRVCDGARRATPVRSQRGATLIITLVMLVLITLLGLSAIRSTTVDEKMAGSSRDRERALQAAEAAMRYCLGQIKNSTYTGTPLVPAAISAKPHWEVATNWSNTNSSPVTIDTTLAAQPRCMYEALGAGTGNYRITGRAVGGSTLTEVMLQATYTAE
jgi:type IV pilus assembly protein PilX